MVSLSGMPGYHVVATALIPSLSQKFGGEIQRLESMSGAALKGLAYTNPLTGTLHPVLAGDFVSTDAGTGLVHTAPAHGLDDYKACRREGIAVLSLGNHFVFLFSTSPSFFGSDNDREFYLSSFVCLLVCPLIVDERGCYMANAGPDLAGLSVIDKGTAKVIEMLATKEVLLKEELYSHRYPYDWRTKKPVILR